MLWLFSRYFRRDVPNEETLEAMRETEEDDRLLWEEWHNQRMQSERHPSKDRIGSRFGHKGRLDEPCVLHTTKRYDADRARLEKSKKFDMSKLDEVIDILLYKDPKIANYHDHPLKGEMKKYRECHISGNWVLVYRYIGPDELVLEAVRTGTHNDVFKE